MTTRGSRRVKRKPRARLGAKKPSAKELERALKESVEQQTATSEILRVISSSPTELQSVFDAIAHHAVRLCDATYSVVGRFDGQLLHVVAHEHVRAEGVQAILQLFPMRPSRATIMSRAVLERAVVHVPDVLKDPDYARPVALGIQNRSTLAVPMLRDGHPIGTISVGRLEPRPFAEKQIALLKTFAEQAVIAIENVRLFQELEGRNRDLTEALQQQTATSEILRVISSAPTDLQPMLDAVAENAARVCGASDALIYRIDGHLLRLAAHYGPLEWMNESLPLSRGSVTGRAAVDRRSVHVHDLGAEPEEEFPVGRALQQRFGQRTVLSTPLLREGAPIGTISIRRMEVHPFSDKQIDVLKTFADQAVIAIENVRLFTELQGKNRALTEAHAQVSEALEQQTATSEILQVISSSPTDLQPVFDIIAESAAKLCGAESSTVTRFDGELVYLVAVYGSSANGVDALRRAFPRRPSGETVAVRSIRDCAIAHIPDVLVDEEYGIQEAAVASGFRAALGVPMLREGRAIGSIAIGRSEAGEFSERQVKLLCTFADQALIAIENVRLFTELEARNKDLTVALEQQTATSEILRVISRSQTDVQPVFDAIVRSAVRLCGADHCYAARFDGELLHPLAYYGFSPEALEFVARSFPMRPSRGTLMSRVALTRAVVNLPDTLADPEYMRAFAVAGGWRSTLGVPMLRDGTLIGVIAVGRKEPAAFAEQHVELLKTFADQAVIAIENVRLFKELEARTAELTRSVGELTALGEVGQAVGSTLDLQTVLDTIVTRAAQFSGTHGGVIYEYDEATDTFHLRATHRLEDELVEALRREPLRLGEGATGKAAATRAPFQVTNILDEKEYTLTRVRSILARLGYRSILAVPLIFEERMLGALVVHRQETGAFAPAVVNLLQTFAAQSALAIQNARLFLEIEDKSRQLEAASRHKSEFLANMSHELRTPLNAITGFSEVLLERMFGEINPKQTEYLQDILSSGRHLLSLINDILDLSKIEAGRMELTTASFHVPLALENAVTLVKERAARHGIALDMDVDPRLGEFTGDERKIKQVLLNLLSNAVKFTPEGGRIGVKAALADGVIEISISDTGIGIAPEDQEAIFEEFRQVGSDEARKREGTGLGLTLTKKFVEMHGGRIWVESEVGKGSTFRFTLPVS